MRSALEFFASAQLCCERSLESVSRVTQKSVFSEFEDFFGEGGFPVLYALDVHLPFDGRVMQSA